MGTFTVFIPGIPAPQGSKRHVGRGILIESSKKLAPWRTLVAYTLGNHPGLELIDSGPIHIGIAFTMPRPKSTPKTRPTPPAVKKPDLDKLVRAILDAGSGVAWRDDSQVISITATKRVAELHEQPGAKLSITAIGVPQ
ncbi:MAG TPA: RusA family crossover junction endodeoxyribonuclease [Gordonia sp. (in: high G+C Gram-positive bacteria)]|nr:RusA family crossover junction endodeoxyribonuclease [Gordonia sp. (in: high G+C Gram-positive bacteria)]